jgi:GH24 family phage-related lysozyme (muramidase)
MGLEGLAISQLFNTGTAAWAAVLILALFVARLWSGAPALFAQWIAYRAAKAAERSADWDRRSEELTRLDQRCRRLETAEERCRTELADMTQRVAALEGYNIGKGKARNDAQLIVSAERQIDADKKGKDQP